MSAMEKYVRENHLITDLEACKYEFDVLLGTDNTSIDETITFVNDEEATIFYFDENLVGKSAEDKDVYYAWIDSGYCYGKDALFISLVKNEFTGVFEGYFVGTADYLVTGIIRRQGNLKTFKTNLQRFQSKYNRKIEKRNRKHLEIDYTSSADDFEEDSVEFAEVSKKESSIDFAYEAKKTPVTEEIYENLLFNNWQSINGLDKYLKRIGCRLTTVVSKEKTDCFIANNKKMAIVNSGLINVFGEHIYLLYRFYENCKSYKVYSVISGKGDYIDNGFTVEQASIDLIPIQFDDGTSTLSTSIDDYDINQKCLIHIIEERKSRFPDSIQDKDAVYIVSRLKSALDSGLKLQSSDSTFAKRIYSGKDGIVSWVLPLHIENKRTEEPELVIAIRKADEFFEVKTVLPYNDELKDKITSMALYGKLW